MQWLRSWFSQRPSIEDVMTEEQFRLEVQRILRAERKVTDVAFTPVGDVDVVHFWDGDIRPQFSVNKRAIKDRQQLALVVKAQAQNAYDTAVKQTSAVNPAPVAQQVKPDQSETIREEVLATLRGKNITDVAIEDLPDGGEKASFWVDDHREEIVLNEDGLKIVDSLKDGKGG